MTKDPNFDSDDVRTVNPTQPRMPDQPNDGLGEIGRDLEYPGPGGELEPDPAGVGSGIGI